MIDPAVFRAMVANGATPEMLLAVVEAAAAVDEEKRERKRAGNAERQARFREAHKDDVTAGNESNALQGVTERDSVTVTPSLDKETLPPTPPIKEINPTPAHTRVVHAHEAGPKAWVCPDGVDPQHWRDFMANRRRKKLTNTDTAYAGQVRLLERFASDEWPPGELVRKSAEKGWGTIVDPDEYEAPRNGQQSSNHGPANRSRGSRADEIDDAARFLGFT